MKKKKIAIIVLISLCCIVLFFAIFSAAKNRSYDQAKDNTATVDEKATLIIASSSGEESFAESKTENAKTKSTVNNKPGQTEYKSYIKPTTEPTYSQQEIDRAKWKSFSIVLNDVNITFPVNITELNKTGYEFATEQKDKNLEFGAVDNPCVFLNGDSKKGFINLYITNDSELSMSYSQCKVIGMTIIFEKVDKDSVIKIGDLVLDKNTSKQDIITYLGVPTQQHKENDIDTIAYYNESGDKYWNLGFKNDKLIGLDIYT